MLRLVWRRGELSALDAIAVSVDGVPVLGGEWPRPSSKLVERSYWPYVVRTSKTAPTAKYGKKLAQSGERRNAFRAGWSSRSVFLDKRRKTDACRNVVDDLDGVTQLRACKAGHRRRRNIGKKFYSLQISQSLTPLRPGDGADAFLSLPDFQIPLLPGRRR